MGGLGSGRHGKYITCDDCWSLDVAEIKFGFLRKKNYFGELLLQITQVEDRIICEYAINSNIDSGSRKQVVKLAHTACNFGGHRSWFICPHCQHRARILYCFGYDFSCRKCCNLRYVTQSMTTEDGKIVKAYKIRRYLGSEIGLGQPVHRPKGMHWTTYWRLQWKIAKLEHDFVMNRIGRFL